MNFFQLFIGTSVFCYIIHRILNRKIAGRFIDRFHQRFLNINRQSISRNWLLWFGIGSTVNFPLQNNLLAVFFNSISRCFNLSSSARSSSFLSSDFSPRIFLFKFLFISINCIASARSFMMISRPFFFSVSINKIFSSFSCLFC